MLSWFHYLNLKDLGQIGCSFLVKLLFRDRSPWSSIFATVFSTWETGISFFTGKCCLRVTGHGVCSRICRHSSFAMHIRNKKFSPQKNAGKEQSRKKNFDRFFILYMYVRLIIAETRGLCEFYIKMHHTATFQSETAGQWLSKGKSFFIKWTNPDKKDGITYVAVQKLYYHWGCYEHS